MLRRTLKRTGSALRVGAFLRHRQLHNTTIGVLEMNHGKEEVRQAVRDRYARAATESTGCCEPSCCGGSKGADAAAQAIGYTAEELKDLPIEANLGLGCGNPTAIASLQPGQTVLDLGSGAEIGRAHV